MKQIVLAALVLTLLLATGGCGGGGGGEEYVMDEPVPSGAEGAVEINLTFTPDEIIPNQATVPAGAKVLFVINNTDTKEDHNLVGSDVGLKEILVHPGQTVRRLWTAYDQPGSYRIGCTIHSWIDMTIVIE